GVGVDLSPEMLRVVRGKAKQENLDVKTVQANLVELDALADGSADYCICMFSTLGMIQGRDNRLRALAHVRRVLKPDGQFVLHVHNLWNLASNPAGRAWLWKVWRQSWRQKRELGDMVADYRGVPRMMLHFFSARELRRDLQQAGFHIKEWIPLDPLLTKPLANPGFLSSFRAIGWIVVCD
ncbi:MAG: class I SAM-dependent methyltransferase, partial [Planctomycetales bacterium]